ncbi:MAG: SDR family oxidoreductase [Clostridiales bacterium]|nr:SDR family oxidoreductase [Clostridiales bacterium]
MLMAEKNIVVMGVANKWSIAWAIAQQLKKAGANLIFTYNREKSGESLRKLLEKEGFGDSTTISCDVTSDEDIRRAFEQIKTIHSNIDGVVHSIAHAKSEELGGNFYDTSREGFLMAQNISAYSLVSVSRYASEIMNDGGSIITLTYLGGEKVAQNYNVMGVAKASLDASVRYLARDLGPRQIRVNAISAGPIKTLAAKGVSGFSKVGDIVKERSPMKRMVLPIEVGNTAVFLLSDMSTGITGEIMHVDCGFNIVSY